MYSKHGLCWSLSFWSSSPQLLTFSRRHGRFLRRVPSTGLGCLLCCCSHLGYYYDNFCFDMSTVDSKDYNGLPLETVRCNRSLASITSPLSWLTRPWKKGLVATNLMAMAEIKYLSFTTSACIGSPPLSKNGNSLTIVNIIYHIQGSPLSMQRY